jgi:predicted SnoaL-like aldol condensation-catalyzing enzyme
MEDLTISRNNLSQKEYPMDNELENNKRIVREFYELAFNEQKPEEAVAKYMGTYYRQHNPQAGDGAEPFTAYVKDFTQTFPKLRMEIKRLIAEGDLVVVHTHCMRHTGDRGRAIMDIFRLEDGKIVEHWDVIQDVPETTANNNTMF